MEDFSKKSNRFRLTVLMAINHGVNDTEAIAKNINTKGDQTHSLRRVNRAVIWLQSYGYISKVVDSNEVPHFLYTGKFNKDDFGRVSKSNTAKADRIFSEKRYLNLIEEGYRRDQEGKLVKKITRPGGSFYEILDDHVSPSRNLHRRYLRLLRKDKIITVTPLHIIPSHPKIPERRTKTNSNSHPKLQKKMNL